MPDGPGPDHSFRDPRASKADSQWILNEVWPFRDSSGPHARGISDKLAEEQVDVVARVVFQDDGETYLQGRAVRWTDDFTHVCISISDLRIRTGLVWLVVDDTRPRAL